MGHHQPVGDGTPNATPIENATRLQLASGPSLPTTQFANRQYGQHSCRVRKLAVVDGRLSDGRVILAEQLINALRE
eukprot:365187-Chlamydomonas_euryale.AAC.1